VKDRERVRARTGSMGRVVAAASAVAMALVAAAPAAAKVTVYRQGVSPTSGYAGCTDTYIEGYGYTRPRNEAEIMRTPGNRRGLIRFELSGIDKGRTVRRAILRLSLTVVPSAGTAVDLQAPSRQWDPTAMWASYKAVGRKPSPDHKWDSPGGDVDKTTDFGAGSPGLVARAKTRGGPFGHVVELDVTKIVGEWVAGKRPNYGLLITKSGSGATFATSEWIMPAYRPALVVEHYGPGEQVDPKAAVTLPPAPGREPALSALATTANAAQAAGATKVVRFGRNSNCQYRTGHMAGYAKQDVRYPGNWGWTPRLRVGGSAGDMNHAVLYFNLSAIPPGAAIKRATLKAFAEVGNQRPPSDTLALGQVPRENDKARAQRIRGSIDAARRLASRAFGAFAVTGTAAAPPWNERQFTFQHARRGAAWTGDSGTLADATAAAPLAVADPGRQWAEMLKKRDAMPETWLAWDVTGAVRAWSQGKLPNRGLVIDGRLMGGEMVIYSDEWIDADRRPYLEVELAGELTREPDGPFEPEPLVLAPDAWIEPMRKVHARWKGTKGTFTQYGDSITVTMAFWTPLKYGEYKGATPEMTEALDTARKYIHKDVWHGWKSGTYGCAGSTTISWAFDNVDQWQKRMNAEAAVVMWGTNDAAGGPHVPIYTEKYAIVINRVLADGTVPILTTLPPFSRQRGSVRMFLTVWNLRLAELYIARANKLPLIDLWAEMVRRRGDDWDGRDKKWAEGGWSGYNVPTMIARDGIHPSFPKTYQKDWTDEGLNSCGLGLRNYLTLKLWYELYQKVLTK